MIAKEGFPFIIGAVIATVVFSIFPPGVFIFISALSALFFIMFFRDPERRSPEEEDIAVSGADGRVVEAVETELDGEDFLKISVFMNIFNVHVNRMPLEGRVMSIVHKPGKFMPADKKESSSENEQNIISVETQYGKAVFKQVAGLIARRTVCYAKPESYVRIGEKLGIIKFSSRFDHYLPASFAAEVRVGDTVKAGETVIGRYSE